MLVSVASFLPILIVGPIADVIGTTVVLGMVAIAIVAAGSRRSSSAAASSPPSAARATTSARAIRSWPRCAPPRCPTPDPAPDFARQTIHEEQRGVSEAVTTAAETADGAVAAATQAPNPSRRLTRPPMPRIAVVFTGGTISMRRDPVAGGNVPVLTGEAILAATPGLASIAEVVPIDRGLTPASHFTFPALFEIYDTVRKALDDPEIAGAVVVQGTDTIEETAFFFDLLHAATSRSPSPARCDLRAPGVRRAGESARRRARRVGRRPRRRGRRQVLAGTIEPADDVTKVHASAFDTFRSLNTGPLGRITAGGEVVVVRPRGPRRHVAATRAAERVHLVRATVAMDGTPIDALRAAGADGFIVEATGAGNTPQRFSPPRSERSRMGCRSG